MKTGIESIGFYSPQYCFDLRKLAAERGVDGDKYIHGIGQSYMAVPPIDEDVVTMGANAAREAIEKVDASAIDAVIFATESGVDQSKSGAVYIHRLLNLPSTCKVVEMKQACAAGTMGVLSALGMIALNPKSKILLIASDIARYGLNTAGEPTSGAGAIAMVLSANPVIMELDYRHGTYAADVMDFWRPNYMDEALVDGKYSIRVYLKALTEAWKDYARSTDRTFDDHDRFCYHLPFTRMGIKAHSYLYKHCGDSVLDEASLPAQVDASLRYNRLTGNLYTGSAYVALLSLLESPDEQLAGKRVALFSYGSGCLGIFYSGVVQADYRQYLPANQHKTMLEQRSELGYEQYVSMYSTRLPIDGSEFMANKHRTGHYRLAGVCAHKRIYESTN